MKCKVANNYIAAGILLFLVFSVGYGADDYEQSRDRRINELKVDSKFNLLSPPINVPGTQVSIRIPQKNDSNQKSFDNLPKGSSGGFEGPALQDSVSPDGKPIDPKRLKPNIIDLSDLKLTFEGFVPDSKQGKQPYYLYVTVSTHKNRGNIPKLMQAELFSKINDASPLVDLKAETPEGRDILWQECHATGKQPFNYVNPEGQSQFVQLNGTITLMFHEENDALVILIWRWPAGLDKSIFQSWMEMTAGCVKVNPKTPAPGGE
jgi:hypothetical protein